MIFNRVGYKDRAKQFLRKHYVFAFIICLICTLFSSSELPSFNFNFDVSTTSGFSNMDIYLPGIFGLVFNVFSVALTGVVFIIIFLIGLALMIFVFNPFQVSRRRYFIGNNYDSVIDLFYPFKSPYYLNIVKTLFVKNLLIIIGFILFIIPGIYLTYRYYFVEYLLAEHPEYTTSEILQLSREMTQGIKVDIFVMDISFFLWYVLGFFLGGLLMYFIQPYVDASFAQMYLDVKKRYEWRDYAYGYED